MTSGGNSGDYPTYCLHITLMGGPSLLVRYLSVRTSKDEAERGSFSCDSAIVFFSITDNEM